jgi:hypothetical protein
MISKMAGHALQFMGGYYSVADFCVFLHAQLNSNQQLQLQVNGCYTQTEGEHHFINFIAIHSS